MGGMYLTNWANTFMSYTTRIVFKSCRVLPVMAFRTLVVGARYGPSHYGAGGGMGVWAARAGSSWGDPTGAVGAVGGMWSGLSGQGSC